MSVGQEVMSFRVRASASWARSDEFERMPVGQVEGDHVVEAESGKEVLTVYCKCHNVAGGSERHLLTFVSTICRYIGNLTTDSFIRTS